MARRPRREPKGDKRDVRVDLAKDPIPSDAPVDTKDADAAGLTEEQAILKQCNDRMEIGWNYWQDTFNLSKEDVRFVYEDQWPDYAKQGRENRPMLTMNQLPQLGFQVTNSMRRAKFSIQVKQIAGKNSTMLDTKTTGKPYSRSQIMEGLVRDIEDRSKAHDLYCDAGQHMVEGGFSWLLVKTMENIDDPFDIEIGIHHVKDRYSCMIDPYAKRPDKSDAMWCSMAMDMPIEVFKEQWPDVATQDWDPGTTTRYRQAEGSYWRGDATTIRIVDYWWKEPMERTAVEFIREMETHRDRLVMWEDEHGPVFDELEEEGYRETQRKTVQTYKVRYMRGIPSTILDGAHDWPSKHLPLVMAKGREVNLENKDVLIGLFRYSHDPQRMVNFWCSAATEKVALMPRAPYIAAAEQMANHQDQWQNMYTANSPVLLYEHIEGVPPPQRQPNTTMAQGELQLVSVSRSLLQDSVGVHDASTGRRSNEVSGVALQERQERGDLGSFDFVDNLARAVVRVGEILVDMIPRCYTTDFIRRVILPDDSEIFVDLNARVEDRQTGKIFRVFSLDFARYACRIDVGPSSKTQREEFVKMMIEWGRSDPDGFQVFRDLVVANMDIPQARVIAQRMKHMVPRHMLSPEDQESIPPPQPTPQDELAKLELEARATEAQAKFKQAEATIVQANLRTAADETRLQFEQEKGLNRQEQAEEATSENAAIDEERIIALINRAVAQALAKRE